MTSTSDRLRWIADFLGLAGKAVSVVACSRGIDYSQDIHCDAQRDLRALAELLDECSQFGADLTPRSGSFGALPLATAEVAEAKTVVSRLCETGEQAEELIDVQQSICRALVMLSELRSTMTVS
jgi:hypothetical protein